MFWVNFWLSNFHFAVMLLGVIASFIMVYVLYISWRRAKEGKLLLRLLGFLLLGAFLGIYAGSLQIGSALTFLKIGAFFLIALSFYKDPLQVVPPEKEVKSSLLTIPFVNNIPGLVVLAVLVATVLRIYKKYSAGLEREFKNLYQGFVFLTISEFFSFLTIFSESRNVFLANLGGHFGLAWILHHFFAVAAFIFILVYAWGYLRFELFTQIFGAFVMTSVFMFVFLAGVYTFLLMREMQRNALEGLRTNLATFEYSVESLQNQGLAAANIAAANSEIRGSLGNSKRLSGVLGDQIVSSGVDFLVAVGDDGRILGRGEDPEATTGSLSDNFVVAQALEGEGKSNLATRDWVNAPLVLIETSAPMLSGAIYTGYILDSAFVDGFKKGTGLDVTVYAGDIKSATTLVGADGVSRLVGARLINPRIQKNTLEKGEVYLGLSQVFQNEYVSAYGPFMNKEGNTLGMFFVGYPSTLLFAAAQTALSHTFYLTVILAVFSFIPAYVLAKFIEKNQA